jgi:hypothetical protein
LNRERVVARVVRADVDRLNVRAGRQQLPEVGVDLRRLVLELADIAGVLRRPLLLEIAGGRDLDLV